MLRRRAGIKWSKYGTDVIPSWIADMDVRACPQVQSAVYEIVGKGDYGYPAEDLQERLIGAFGERMSTKFGWIPDTQRTRVVTEVVQGTNAAISCFTEPGDGVLLFTPSYPPFLSDIDAMGRSVVEQPLRLSGKCWTFDEEELEANAAKSTALLLVNPHNPTGKVFSKAELETIAAVAERHDLTLLSDEIHQDFVWSGQHVPIATLGAAAKRTATLTSATKGFNLAGMRCAFVHLGDDLVDRWDRQFVGVLGSVSTVGVVATIAAWSEGQEWQQEVLDELRARRQTVTVKLERDLPDIGYVEPDSTYLSWLNMGHLGLDDPAEWFETNAGVGFGHGPDFGELGVGHCRLNFATSDAVLDAVLARLSAGYETLTNLTH